MTAGDVIVVDGAVGPARQAAAFDGTDDYILADAHAVARVAANDTVGTYSAWVYFDNVATAQNILSVGDNDSATETFTMGINNLNILNARLYFGGEVKWKVSQLASTFKARKWHHIAVVQNGVQPVIYIDGVLASTFNETFVDLTYWYDELVNCDKFAIGVKESNGTHTDDFSGMISDVKYWNKALTAAEVAKDYNGEALADDGTYLQLHLLKGDYGVKDQGLGADNGTLTGHAYLCGWGSEWSRNLDKAAPLAADSIQTIPYERGRARTVIIRNA